MPQIVEQTKIIVITETGMILKFDSKNVRTQGRNQKGVKAIMLRDGDKVVASYPVYEEEE